MKLLLVTLSFLMAAQAQAADILKYESKPLANRPNGVSIVITVDNNGAVLLYSKPVDQLHSTQVAMINELIAQSVGGAKKDNRMGIRCLAVPSKTVKTTAIDAKGNSLVLNEGEQPCGDVEWNDTPSAQVLTRMMNYQAAGILNRD